MPSGWGAQLPARCHQKAPHSVPDSSSWVPGRNVGAHVTLTAHQGPIPCKLSQTSAALVVAWSLRGTPKYLLNEEHRCARRLTACGPGVSPPLGAGGGGVSQRGGGCLCCHTYTCGLWGWPLLSTPAPGPSQPCPGAESCNCSEAPSCGQQWHLQKAGAEPGPQRRLRSVSRAVLRLSLSSVCVLCEAACPDPAQTMPAAHC